MDTSKEYIKMCRKFYNSLKLEEKLQLFGFPEIGFNCINITRDGNWWWHGDLLSDCIPLPRQDQLQEMIGSYPDCYLEFVNWNEISYPIIAYPLQKQQPHPFWYFKSLEQLWLAYVMKRKFNKIWDGENWVYEK